MTYVKGLRVALKSINATQSDQYSWIAKVGDEVIFTAEIDHRDSVNNRYDHKEGTFHKKVEPLTLDDGAAGQTVRHYKELFAAVSHVYSGNLVCKLMLLKGTKSGTTPGGVRAAIDGDNWVVKNLSGNISDGFVFDLVRVGN